MPRPSLPKAEEVAGLARVLRAEGFSSICIETTPDGHVSITVGKAEGNEKVTPLENWKAKRAAS